MSSDSTFTIAQRKRVVLHYLRNGQDAERTLSWFLKEFATHPLVRRTKYVDRLAKNIMLMGGSGNQREMNAKAFMEATQEYYSETVASRLRRENEELQKKLQLQVDRNYDLNREISDLHAQVAGSQNTVISMLASGSAA